MKKIQSSQNWRTPPVGVFSPTISHRDLKLGTHMQVPHTTTPAKFQGHPPIKTPFTSHMCDIQGRCAKNVNFVIYLYAPH